MAFGSTVGIKSASDIASVLKIAVTLDDGFATLDTQVASIVSTARAQLDAKGVLPSPPPSLRLLQAQKLVLMDSIAPTFVQQLSSSASAALDA
jgi:malate synthase